MKARKGAHVPTGSKNIALMTWNARGGDFLSKTSLLRDFDVAVVSEAAMPPASALSKQCCWVGASGKKGVAVLAREPYSIRPLPELPDVPPFVVPFAVEGSVPLTLLAVWTKANDHARRYIRAAALAIDMYESLFTTGPVVVMGDFNSNAIWDRAHPVGLNHFSVVSRLERHGLVSAYHRHRGCRHGEEPEPTYYQHGEVTMPYHIDYVFIPDAWAEGLAHVEVGGFPEWERLSDHRPVTARVCITQRAEATT